MGDVVRTFKPQIVGQAFRFDADALLEAAKGQGFVSLVLIGEYEGGELWTSGTANAGQSVILLERAKHQIVFPESD